ncbi:MAG: NAD(P)H-hydrate epimerase [Planctomycetes bacterium]|nr:NAD(P)H-hydrate epimerase [Planctomycetota bacterium]
MGPRAKRPVPGPRPRDVIRRWDRLAVERYGLPSIVLMENAGAGAAAVLAALTEDPRAPCPEPFVVLCGPGNNGGDGFVVARHLHNRGFRVEVLAAGGAGYPPGSDAAVNLEVVRRMGLSLDLGALLAPPPGRDALRRRGAGTVVDAIFGTGLSRPVRAPFLEWIEAVSSSGAAVAALDLPSGLDADSGEPLGACVRAHHTITFAAPKLGFGRGLGPSSTGEVHVVDIGIPRELLEEPAG